MQWYSPKMVDWTVPFQMARGGRRGYYFEKIVSVGKFAASKKVTIVEEERGSS